MVRWRGPSCPPAKRSRPAVIVPMSAFKGDNVHTYLKFDQLADPPCDIPRSERASAISRVLLESAWDMGRQARHMKDVDVCLVEDDPSITCLVQSLTESAGIDLLSVDSCEGAILALRNTRPRLLLVDLGLPDRSGLEIARVVRGWYEYPRIPIIAVTGSPDRAGAAWRAGFSGFIAKPFVPATFQAMVKSWIGVSTQ
jgi:CheY-like chemotaxis protein